MRKDPFQQFSGEIRGSMNEMLKFQGFLPFLREFCQNISVKKL